MPRDLAVFLRELIKNPSDVRALAPSSRTMARVMVQGLSETSGPIVEIGPGTGVFTRAILDAGVAPERLTLFELNPRFCDALRTKFPGVTVLNRSAAEMHLEDLGTVDAVLSGVPLLNRPDLQKAIVTSILQVLADTGTYTQFTYAFSSPITAPLMKDLGISARKKATIWANIPPATVFEYRRA